MIPWMVSTKAVLLCPTKTCHWLILKSKFNYGISLTHSKLRWVILTKRIIYGSLIIFHFNMPTGKEFSVEEKILIFRVIEFVGSERNSLQIPLTSTSARVMTIFGISYSSVYCLMRELEALRHQTAVEDGRKDEVMNIEDSTIRTPAQASSVAAPTGHRKSKETWSVKEIASRAATEVPESTAPKKKENVGRRQVTLSENAEDAIRYHFHLILAKTQY